MLGYTENTQGFVSQGTYISQTTEGDTKQRN